MSRKSRMIGHTSVELKCALLLADKEVIEAKKQQAIQEEAEKKRRKKEAAERAKNLIKNQNNDKIPEKVPYYSCRHVKDDKLDTDMDDFTENIGENLQVGGTLITPKPEEEEQKYVGPLLHGSAPEMIVSSGALGMTNTRKRVQINYQPPPKRVPAESDLYERESEYVPEYSYAHSSTSMGPRRLSRIQNDVRPYTRTNKVPTVRDYINGDFEFSNDFDPPSTDIPCSSNSLDSPAVDFTSPQFIVPKSVVEDSMSQTRSPSAVMNDPISQSILSVIEKAASHVPQEPAPMTFVASPEPIGTFYYEEDTMNQTEEIRQEPVMTDEEIQMEKDRLRYKEIGRRICELELSDFSTDKTKNDRKSFAIASRGEEILDAVRRNLNFIRDKLGEYAEGTIFDHVDELTNSFGDVSPETMSRLNLLVTEKLRRREEEEAAAARRGERVVSMGRSTSPPPLLDVKVEDKDVKLEPIDYPEEYGNY